MAGEVITDMVPAGAPGLFRAAPGGSPANVAVGVARLDVPVRMLARLSADVLGRALREHLAANGVDLSHAVEATEPSSLAIVALGADGSADYDFRVADTADWQWTHEELRDALDGVVALHVGSIAVTTPPGGEVLRGLAAAGRATATVCYDPNVRPLLMGTAQETLAVVEEMLDVADVVKASDDDVAWLLPGRTAEDVATDWCARGPALVVVTRGSQGAVAVGRSAGMIHCPGAPVEVVDTVGAGDSFMSALIAGLYQRDLLGAHRRAALLSMAADDVADVVAEAVTASGITCARLGADPPTRAELTDALARTDVGLVARRRGATGSALDL